MIETARLLLRPPADADVPAIAEGLSNFNVSRWTGRIPHPYSEEAARDFLVWSAGLPEGALTLSITVKPVSKVVGGIGYQLTATDPVPELGYWLAEPYWGQGYGSEAAEAITAHAFRTAGHRELVASYHLGNEASHHILTRLGFAEIRRGPSYCLAQGRDVECAFLTLPRAVWEARRTAPI